MTDLTQHRTISQSESGSAVPTGLLIVLASWLGLALPIFLRMPLTNDAELFDLHVRMLASGKVLYQDILEPNLPGVIWVHTIVRSLAGPSSETLRSFDLLVFGGLMILAYRWLRLSGMSRGGGTAAILSASVFYLSGSEWIHCQRDTWMLAVSFAAAALRCHFLEKRGSQSAQQVAMTGVLEGMIWGAGIWIKPYVVLVAVAVWLISASRNSSIRQIAADGAGVLAGGVLAGIAGFSWMSATGCLTAFFDQAREWNPHYFSARSAQWTLDRFVPMVIRFLPWMLLHPVAMLVSAGRLKRALQRAFPRTSGASEAGTEEPAGSAALRHDVLAAFYLAWCVHTFLLQHLFDYVHAPGVLLAILVTAGWVAQWKRAGAARFVGYAFAAATVLLCPYLDPQRISDWTPAVFDKPDAALRDRLARFENPNRVDMEAVAGFLKAQGARDGDVVCFNSDLISLYRRLGFTPPAKFIYIDQNAAYVPSAADTILQTLLRSGHRYVVADLLTSGLAGDGFHKLTRDGRQVPPVHLPDSAGIYPWGQPVVFRAGWYLVHEITETSATLHIPGTPLRPAGSAAGE